MGHLNFDFSMDDFGVATNEQEEAPGRERKVRAPNAFPYHFGDVWKANWYVLFLNNCAGEWTYFLSPRDRLWEFRCLFQMPLHKINDLVTRYVENGWVQLTKHCQNEEEMTCSATILSEHYISTCEHRAFFRFFIDCMYGIRHEFVDYPSSEEELDEIVKHYDDNYLPGC
ncbi:hypothetical protein HJC23_008411, partial [Cyclotella cryptica]